MDVAVSSAWDVSSLLGLDISASRKVINHPVLPAMQVKPTSVSIQDRRVDAETRRKRQEVHRRHLGWSWSDFLASLQLSFI